MSRRLIAITLAAVLVLTGVWYVALWSPQGATLRQAQTRSAAAGVHQHALASEAAVLQLAQSQIPIARAKLDALNTAIPVVPGLATIIDDLYAVGAAAGVRIVSLSPGVAAVAPADAAAATGPTAMPVSISTTGSYAQSLDFINRLNAMPRLMVLNPPVLGIPDPITGQMVLSLVGNLFTAPAS